MKRNKEDVVCYCMEVTYETILTAIKNGAKTPDDITEITDAGSSCGVCIETIEEILEEELTKQLGNRAETLGKSMLAQAAMLVVIAIEETITLCTSNGDG